jgi:hypothetical protein
VNYLRFVLGGNDNNRYPAFNGQFSRPVFRIGYGAFIDEVSELNKYALSCNPVPE